MTKNASSGRCELLLDLDQRHAASQAGDDERPPRTAKPSIVCEKGGNLIGRECCGAVNQSEMCAANAQSEIVGVDHELASQRHLALQGKP